MSPGSRSGDRVSPGTGASGGAVALRYKSSHWSKPLIDFTNKKAIFASPPLQEILSAQPAVLIGLIAHLTGTPLQDELARTTDRLLRLGQDILATSTARGGMTESDSGHGRDRLRDIL